MATAGTYRMLVTNPETPWRARVDFYAESAPANGAHESLGSGIPNLRGPHGYFRLYVDSVPIGASAFLGASGTFGEISRFESSPAFTIAPFSAQRPGGGASVSIGLNVRCGGPLAP